jgi:hypothetical protein
MDVTHGTTLAAAAGVATASSDVGALGGGSIGWEFNRRLGIEGSGLWLDRGIGSGAFVASLTVQTNLTRPRTVVPFVEGGPAMYRASFDVSRSTIPAFYRDRMSNRAMNTTVVFRDPAFVVGGGVNLFAMGHLAIRPVMDVLVAMRNSHAYKVASFTVRAVYHFHDHPVTP